MNTGTSSTQNTSATAPWSRWWLVVAYATAMAWVESAVVLYLRTMTDRIEPYQLDAFPYRGGLAAAELVREAATLMMLLTVGWLAGRNWRSRFGYALLAFGVWDIFYYVFLKVLTGWPHGLLNWDLLFLLPLPWWGPVIAPVLIALLMIIWGTLVNHFVERETPRKADWFPMVICAVGIVLALYVFMADTLRVAGQGPEAIRNVLPVQFNWPLFGVALVLMTAPVVTEFQRRELPGFPFNTRTEVAH